MADRVGNTNSQDTYKHGVAEPSRSLPDPQTSTKVAAVAPSAIPTVSSSTSPKVDESLIKRDAKRIAWIELIRNPELDGVKSEEIKELIEKYYPIINKLQYDPKLIKVFYTTLFDEIGNKPDIYNESYIEEIFNRETLLPSIFLEINELKKASDKIANPVDRTDFWHSFYGWFGDFLATKYIQDLKLEAGKENWQITSRLAQKTSKELFELAADKYGLSFLLRLDPRDNQGESGEMIGQSISYFDQVVHSTVSNSQQSALASNPGVIKPFNFLDDWKKKNLPSAGDVSKKLGKDLARHYSTTKGQTALFEESFIRLHFFTTNNLYGLKDFCKEQRINYLNCSTCFQEEFKRLASIHKSTMDDRPKFVVDLESLEEINTFELEEIVKNMVGSILDEYPQTVVGNSNVESLFEKACDLGGLKAYFEDTQLDPLERGDRNDLKNVLQKCFIKHLTEQGLSDDVSTTSPTQYTPVIGYPNSEELSRMAQKIAEDLWQKLSSSPEGNLDELKSTSNSDAFTKACKNFELDPHFNDLKIDELEKKIRNRQKEDLKTSFIKNWESFKNDFDKGEKFAQSSLIKVKQRRSDSIPNPEEFFETVIKLAQKKGQRHPTSKFYKDGFIYYINKVQQNNQSVKEQTGAPVNFEKSPIDVESKQDNVTTVKQGKSKKAEKNKKRKERARAKVAEEKRVKEEASKEVAVTKLQKTVRGFIAKRAAQKEVENKVSAAKAAEEKRVKEEAAKEVAVTKLQKTARGFIARKSIQKEEQIASIAEKASAAAKAAAQAAASKAEEEARKYQLQRDGELAELAKAKDTATLLQTQVNELDQRLKSLDQSLKNAEFIAYQQQQQNLALTQQLINEQAQTQATRQYAAYHAQRVQAAEVEIARLQAVIQQLMANQHGY